MSNAWETRTLGEGWRSIVDALNHNADFRESWRRGELPTIASTRIIQRGVEDHVERMLRGEEEIPTPEPQIAPLDNMTNEDVDNFIAWFLERNGARQARFSNASQKYYWGLPLTPDEFTILLAIFSTPNKRTLARAFLNGTLSTTFNLDDL